MFDVPPPNEVRGKLAYRETWPPFFEWQKQGALFEIVSLELVAGSDVAYAFAPLRCGTPEELQKDPQNRLSTDHRSAQIEGRVGGGARASSFPLP